MESVRGTFPHGWERGGSGHDGGLWNLTQGLASPLLCFIAAGLGGLGFLFNKIGIKTAPPDTARLHRAYYALTKGQLLPGAEGDIRTSRVPEMVRRGGVRNTAGRTRRKAPHLEQREGEDGCRDRQVCRLGDEDP